MLTRYVVNQATKAVKRKLCSIPGTSQGAIVVKNPLANAGDLRDMGFIPSLERCPGGGKWQPTPIFLPGKSQGQRSLEGYRPWGRKQMAMTDYTYTQYVYTHILYV